MNKIVIFHIFLAELFDRNIIYFWFDNREEFKKEEESPASAAPGGGVGGSSTNKSSTFKNPLLLPLSGFSKLKKEILDS